jgi:protein SCO1/2
MVVPHQPLASLSRRGFLGGVLALGLARPGIARAHSNAGAVNPPEPAPSLMLTLDNGKTLNMRQLLNGKASAVQVMFSVCRATCPIQGAVFAQAAKELGALPKAQLLSISIDPERDDPKTLRAWLARHGDSPQWHAARPEPSKLDGLMDFLKARASGADRHTAQVYFFDKAARLSLRSVDFPPASEIVRVLGELSERS